MKRLYSITTNIVQRVATAIKNAESVSAPVDNGTVTFTFGDKTWSVKKGTTWDQFLSAPENEFVWAAQNSNRIMDITNWKKLGRSDEITAGEFGEDYYLFYRIQTDQGYDAKSYMTDAPSHVELTEPYT